MHFMPYCMWQDLKKKSAWWDAFAKQVCDAVVTVKMIRYLNVRKCSQNYSSSCCLGKPYEQSELKAVWYKTHTQVLHPVSIFIGMLLGGWKKLLVGGPILENLTWVFLRLSPPLLEGCLPSEFTSHLNVESLISCNLYLHSSVFHSKFLF